MYSEFPMEEIARSFSKQLYKQGSKRFGVVFHTLDNPPLFQAMNCDFVQDS
jgi:hypothetical protein